MSFFWLRLTTVVISPLVTPVLRLMQIPELLEIACKVEENLRFHNLEEHLNLICVLESPEKLLQLLTLGPHSRPMKSVWEREQEADTHGQLKRSPSVAPLTGLDRSILDSKESAFRLCLNCNKINVFKSRVYVQSHCSGEIAWNSFGLALFEDADSGI